MSHFIAIWRPPQSSVCAICDEEFQRHSHNVFASLFEGLCSLRYAMRSYRGLRKREWNPMVSASLLHITVVMQKEDKASTMCDRKELVEHDVSVAKRRVMVASHVFFKSWFVFASVKVERWYAMDRASGVLTKARTDGKIWLHRKVSLHRINLPQVMKLSAIH